MKVHVRADVDCGAVHTAEVTAANEVDINVLLKLLRAEDEVIFDDAGTPVMNTSTDHSNWEYAALKRSCRQYQMRDLLHCLKSISA